MGAQVVYISGTNIASMSKKFGKEVQAAGIKERFSNLKQMEVDLNNKLKKIKGGTMVGLLQAASFLRRDMDTTPPLIPIDTGALRESWFVRQINSNIEHLIKIECGFGDNSVNYALYVHEMTSPPYSHEINWSRPGSGPKFFEAAIARNINSIIFIVKTNVEIK